MSEPGEVERVTEKPAPGGQPACGSPSPDGPPPATREITEEEWIASTQACCGVEPE